MIKRYFYSIILFIFLNNSIFSTENINVHLNAISIDGLPGVQSYALGVYGDYWVIIGGRLDGLHRRQPVFSFSYEGNNKQIYLINIKEKKYYSTPLSSLKANIFEQLTSTNMQFHQRGNYLYLVGGYGFSVTANQHITYPALIAIDLPNLVNSVLENGNIDSSFRIYNDSLFAVTGGYLQMIDDTFYLIGGHKFTGRYNPMNGPSFTQTYTNQVRKFKIDDDGSVLSVNHIEQITDSAAFHRRDYNVAPQIMPDGTKGLTAFSGVFRPEADIPYLSSVNINASTYEVVEGFAQYLNHYHCAHLAIHNKEDNMMHTLFFGGIAQYFYENGELVQDDNVPFVNTIARVTRYADGSMKEFKLNSSMPGFLGASAEFIPVNSDFYYNGILDLNALESDSVLIGYIYGGINSSESNIFFTDDGTKSITSLNIYEVYLVLDSPNSIQTLNEQSIGNLKMQLFPMPGNGEINLALTLDKPGNIQLLIHNINGQKIVEDTISVGSSGRFLISKYYREMLDIGTYVITVVTESETCSQKYIMNQ